MANIQVQLDSDSFNGSQGQLLSAYNANWQPLDVDFSEIIISNPPGAGVTYGTYSLNRRGGQTWTDNHWAQITATVAQVDFDQVMVGVRQRTDGVASGYFGGFNYGYGDSHYRLLVATNFMSIVLEESTQSAVQGDVINLEAVASIITLRVNGIVILTHDISTDFPAFPSGGAPGFWLRSDKYPEFEDQRITNWRAGSVTQGADAVATCKCSVTAALTTSGIWTDVGFNFRGAGAGVTDQFAETAVLGEAFPHIYLADGPYAIGVQAGWVGAGIATALRDITLDRRLAGINSKVNDGNLVPFKVTLPTFGNWDIYLALGDGGAQRDNQFCVLKDGSVQGEFFAIIQAIQPGTAIKEWLGVDGIKYSDVTWPSTGSLVKMTHGFLNNGDGTGTFEIHIGTVDSLPGSTTLAHLRLVRTNNQGATMAAQATGKCSTFSLIKVPFSATAKGVCSTVVSFGVEFNGAAAGVCSTAATLGNVSTGFAATPSGVCSVIAVLNATTRTLKANAGCSCSTTPHPTQQHVEWDQVTNLDLAGYLVAYDVDSGAPYAKEIDVGLLQPNVLIRTGEFENAAWVKQGVRVDPNWVAPDGSLTAYKMIQDVSTGFHWSRQTVASVPAGVYTTSIYLRAAEFSLVFLDLFGDAVRHYAAEFDLNAGIVVPGSTSAYPGTTPLITPLGGGWYRCSVSGVIAAGPIIFSVAINSPTHLTQYIGDGQSGIYMWAPQAEVSAAPTAYSLTTTVKKVGYMVTGLIAGLTWFFASRAYDATGNRSAYSTQISKLIALEFVTQIRLAAAPSCVCSTVASLLTTGAVNFTAAATGKCSVTAAITTTITLAAAATGKCSTAAVMPVGVGATFAASATGVCSVTAAITAAITPRATAIGICATVATISFPPQIFQAAASCVCKTVAALSTAITLGQSSAGVCSVTAAITTQIRLAAAPSGACSTVVSLFGISSIFATAKGVCSTSAALTTAITAKCAAVGSCSTVASLNTSGPLAMDASPVCSALTSTTLETAITLASIVAKGSCATSATLGTFIAGIHLEVVERFDDRGESRGIFLGGGS